jgi:hypothetical protein
MVISQGPYVSHSSRWQNIVGGERVVQKSLRKALIKYKLYKDQVIFDRAYGYIKENYKNGESLK